MRQHQTLPRFSRVLEPSVDALLAQALRVFDADPVGARLRLASVLNRGVDRSMITAMLAKSIAKDDPQAALALLEAAIEREPHSLSLWSQYWQVLATDGEAASGLRQRVPWQSVLNNRLRWLDCGAELRAILALLNVVDAERASMGAPVMPVFKPFSDVSAKPLETTPRYLGHCRWDVQKQLVVGWALDRWAIHEPCVLTVRRVNNDYPNLARQGQLLADAPVAWIAKAQISTVGGFSVKLGQLGDCFSVQALSLAFASGEPLTGRPLACVSAMPSQSETAPAAQAAQADGSARDSNPRDSDTFSPVVDVLVPVYEGRDHVLACIESLLQVRALQTTPHQIVVLDDASQDPTLIEALQAHAQAGDIVLVQRLANLGFIRNINRGMAMHTNRDVVWLNADTWVTGDWLDRLRAAAYASDNTATATPWSNDGEFMTLAGKSNPEPMPTSEAQQALDRVIGALNLPPQALVAGCGFCFYVKRKAINAVGYLDETHLIDGYGEETDWCLRARQNGWRHVAATNLFVGHAAGQSFGMRKAALATHNNDIIRKRYPLAQRMHDTYLQQDPLKPDRERIARARWQQWLDNLATKAQSSNTTAHQSFTLVIKRSPSLMPDTQDTQSLQSGDKQDMTLHWQVTGTDIQVTFKINRQEPSLQLTYRLPSDTDQLVQDLNRLSALNVSAHALSQDIARMPAHLSELLGNTLGSIKPIAQAKAKKRAVVTQATRTQATSTFDGLALIVDDLRDPSVVRAWVDSLQQMQAGVCFIATQNTPGTQVLRRTGRVAPMFCPQGLSWKQWLSLLGVKHAVTLAPETAFIDGVYEELNLDLPLRTRRDWLSHASHLPDTSFSEFARADVFKTTVSGTVSEALATRHKRHAKPIDALSAR